MVDGAERNPESDPATSCVLLVDDNPLLLKCFKRALENRDLSVVTCTSARAALDHVATGRVEVVISDISMPEMSGLELLRRAHRLDPDLPVILLTGVPCIDTAAGAVEHGAFSYLLKPVGTDVLLLNIARAPDLYHCARAPLTVIATVILVRSRIRASDVVTLARLPTDRSNLEQLDRGV